MSFLSTFIRFTIILFVLALVGYYVGREVILYMAAEQVASDARSLQFPKQWEEYLAGCSTSRITGSTPYAGFQLRFVDQSQYVLEVDCTTVQPVERERVSLMRGVEKSLGSAGFYYNFATQTLQGELQVDFFGRSRVIYADGESVKHIWGTTNYTASRPASACQAFGYVCCDAETEQGEGELLSAGVVDCSQNCYQSCLQRPTLLSFVSDPPLDYEQRTIYLQGTSSLVLFSFDFDESAAPIESVTIDFGDGTSQTVQKASSLLTKEYSCPQGTCVFPVTVQAVDVRGVASPITRLSSMSVQMN